MKSLARPYPAHASAFTVFSLAVLLSHLSLSVCVFLSAIFSPTSTPFPRQRQIFGKGHGKPSTRTATSDYSKEHRVGFPHRDSSQLLTSPSHAGGLFLPEPQNPTSLQALRLAALHACLVSSSQAFVYSQREWLLPRSSTPPPYDVLHKGGSAQPERVRDGKDPNDRLWDPGQ